MGAEKTRHLREYQQLVCQIYLDENESTVKAHVIHNLCGRSVVDMFRITVLTVTSRTASRNCCKDQTGRPLFLGSIRHLCWNGTLQQSACRWPCEWNSQTVSICLPHWILWLNSILQGGPRK